MTARDVQAARALGTGVALLGALGVLGGGLGLFLARERALAGGWGFPLDDSWIHLHFARNLADGAGFSYNPGVPVSGSTAPLWTLVLAAAFAVAGAHGLWAKVLGVALAVAVVLLTWRLAGEWTGRPALGLLAAAIGAASAPLVWGALSGMEVVLAAALVTAGLLADARGRAWATGVLLGLAALARPEAVLLLPLVWLAAPLAAGRAVRLALSAALVLAPWVAFNLWTAGSLLPTTASAKVEGGLLALASGVREPWRLALVERPLAFLWEWVGWLWSVNALLPILIPPGLVALARRRGRAVVAPALILVLHPLAMAWLAAYRGPAFQEGRYSAHLLPLAVAVAVASLAGLASSSGRLRRSAAAALGAGLLVAAAVGLWPAASRYGWAVQNIQAMQVHLGGWVAAHTPPEAHIAVNDLGAIAYLSRRHVVDLMGLISPEIIPFRRQGEAGILRYLARVCPDYVIIFPEWFPEISRRGDLLAPLHRVRLDRNTVAGADEMVVYETVWNRWRPDPRPCDDTARSRTASGGTAPDR